MAQLPYLMYDQKPSMSSQNFKELALSLLNKIDGERMKYLSLELDIQQKLPVKEDDTDVQDEKKAKQSSKKENASTGSTFIDDWRQWNSTVRLNLARHRSLKLYKDVSETAEPPVLPADAYAASAAVFTHEGSPLEREILLDKARWTAIEQLSGNDFFDCNNVYAYYLKLLILERRQLFDAESGFSEYKSIYSQIIENSHNKTPEGLSSGNIGDDKKTEKFSGEIK